MLSDSRINQIWRAGYCIDLVLWSRRPEASEERNRLAYLADHQQSCRDCNFANILKGLELETAEAMGPKAKMDFHLGNDISTRDDFHGQFKRTMEAAISSGRITPLMLAWMSQVARRRDYEWRR
jgi:hypothetical protein